jgi:hypothetical protein
MKFYKDSNNNIYAYELDGSQDHLIGDKVSVTQAEVDAMNAAKKQEYLDSLSYVEKRQTAYAPLAEQLDMQYHDTMNGTETWLDHIRSVKEAHPKEGE